MTIGGATYVPLRFVAESLGAQATFNPRANRVEVVSSLVGRNPGSRAAGRRRRARRSSGRVSAVDLNSSPESLTVERGGAARTVAITSDAHIELQDVVARIGAPGSLGDVHVGDAVSVIVLPRRPRRFGHRALRVADRDDRGRLADPVRVRHRLHRDAGQVDDDNAQRRTRRRSADLKIGDAVVVRLNPDTNEKRQIIASRAVTATAAPAGPVAIASFTIDAQHALRAGDAFEVALHGTPGGRATFDIGTYVTGLAAARRRSPASTPRTTRSRPT